MSKKPSKTNPMSLSEWITYLFSLIDRRSNATYLSQQSDFVKIIIILTGVNIGFLWLNLATEYNFYLGVFKPIAFIGTPLIGLYLIYKFVVIYFHGKKTPKRRES